MKTNRLFTLALTVLATACGSSQTNRVTAANAAVNPTTGQTVTTATGQAVSQDANSRFNSAAQSMRTHDDANSGRGDWTNDSCNEVAGQFEEAAQAQPNGNFPEAWFNRGMVFARCNMTDQATQALNRSVQAGGERGYCRAKVQLGVQAFRRRDVPTARAAFEEAIRLDPTHCVEGYTNLAMVLREAGPTTDQQWGEVIRNIRAALALDDRYLPARNQLALSYLQQAGDDPNSQRIFLAGLVCAQAAQVAAAAQAELTADVRGFMADLHNTWGIIDIRRGEIIKALGHFQRAYQLNPSMFEAWVNYGTINLSFRGYQDAREAFQHAVELRADNYDAHIGLGVALRGLARVDATPEDQRPGLITQAQQEYERARTLDGNRPDAYYNLGVLNMSYLGGQTTDLEHARDFLQQFQQHAGAAPRYATPVQQARHHIDNINQTLTAMRAMASIPGAGAQPTPPANNTPPSGETPPASGATPAPATPAPATPAPATPAPATPAPAAAPAPAAH